MLERKRRLDEQGSNTIQNWAWHIEGTQRQAEELRGRIQFHTTKILLVIDRLSVRLLTDIDARVDDILAIAEENLVVSEVILLELRQLRAAWAAQAAGHVEATATQDIHFAGPDTIQRFELYRDVDPPARPESSTFLVEGFNVLLACFEKSREGTEQTPESYLMLLKARWILSLIKASQSYQDARPGLYYRRAINQVGNAITQRAKGTGLIAYDESTLLSLPDSAFHIWTQATYTATMDEDPTAPRPDEEELVRLPLASDGTYARDSVVIFRRSYTHFRIVRVTKLPRREIVKEKDLLTADDALIPRYALPSIVGRPVLEIATFSRGEEILYRFDSEKELYAFQKAFTGYEVSWDQSKIQCQFSNQWLDCSGRIQILQDPIPSRNIDTTSPTSSGSSDQSPPELMRRGTRQSSIVESLAPTTVSFVDGGLEAEDVRLPAVCIFTKLLDKEKKKRFAISYFELDPGIVLMPDKCDCHRPKNTCRRLVLQRRDGKKFRVRVVLSRLDARGNPDPNSFDLLPFSLPRHPKFSQVIVRETSYALLQFDTLQEKKTFEEELNLRFKLRDRQITDLNATMRRIKHRQDRPERQNSVATATMDISLQRRPTFDEPFAARVPIQAPQVPMPDTGAIFPRAQTSAEEEEEHYQWALDRATSTSLT